MSTTLFDELRSGTAPPLLPITVGQFQQMIQQGILRDGDPVELIDGLLVRKDRSAHGKEFMGHSPRHALLVMRLQRLLQAGAVCEAAGWHVRIQLPVVLNEISSPEPDIAVVRGTEEDYADHHPGPADLALVIEVADSSLATDRSTKHRLYATAGIAQYWIVNIPESQVEVFEQPDPSAGQFSSPTIIDRQQTLICHLPSAAPIEIRLADLFR